MEAYRVDFTAVLLADNQADAMARVKYWRSLAAAAGWDPGSGVTRSLPPGEVTPEIQARLERERARQAGVASTGLRDRAVEAVASHMDGDLDAARKLVKSMEDEAGRLPAVVAQAFAAARKAAASEAQDG